MSFDGLNVIFLCVGKGSRLKSRFRVPPDELLIKDEHRMVMFALADAPLTLEELCAKLGMKRDAVESVLKTLVNANLVKRICGKYATTIPVISNKKAKLIAEYLEEPTAHIVDVLERRIGHLKAAYSKTRLSKSFMWSDVAHIIVDALLMDLSFLNCTTNMMLEMRSISGLD